MEPPAPATDTSAVDAAPAWRMLGWLAAAELLGMSLWFSATAVTPSLVEAFHLSPAEAAWLTMAVQGGFVIGTLVTAVANLADVFPAKRLMGAGCIAGAMANTAALLAVSPLTLIATRVLTGAALAWVYPPAMKLVAGWFRRHRGVALGVLVGALTLGKATPHLLTALFGGDWQTSMSFTSTLALAGAAVALGVVRDGPLAVTAARFDMGAIRRIAAVREVRLVTLGYLGHMWELYAMWAWVGAFAAASLAASGMREVTRPAALVAFIAIGTGAVGCVLAGRLADVVGRARIARASMVVSAACALGTVLAYGRHPAWLVLLVAVWGFSVVADSAQFSALVSEHAPADAVGTALTLQTSLGFLLTMVTIDALPRVAAAAGWQWACTLLALGPVVGTLAMGRLRAPAHG
ncbi:MAG: MFS transporter [Acidobacteria bacterium]|nr:MFS transporter [Acidobacteriota bacterium]